MGRQVCHHNVVVDGSNMFLEERDLGIYAADTPHGPYTCLKCEKVWDDIPKFPALPKQPDVWFEWKEQVIIENELYFLTPRRDPMEYEFPINFMFDTKEEAYKFLEEWNIDREESKNWVLVKITQERADI